MWLCDRKRHLPGESEVIDERLPALSRQRVDIRCPPPDQRSKAWESGFAVGKGLYRENKVPFGPAPRRHIASGAARMNNVRYTAYVSMGSRCFGPLAILMHARSMTPRLTTRGASSFGLNRIVILQVASVDRWKRASKRHAWQWRCSKSTRNRRRPVERPGDCGWVLHSCWHSLRASFVPGVRG